MPVGGTWQLKAVHADVSLTQTTGAIAYSSSAPGVATVNPVTGLVTAISPGVATISAASNAGILKVTGQVLGTSYALRDRFAKPDSSVSVGTAETGQAWAAQGSSVAGILSNRVYFPTASTDGPVVADCGLSDGLFTFQLSAPGFGHAYYLRWTDSSNYMKVWSQAGTISVNGVRTGSTIGLFVFSAVVNPDDLLAVRLSGSNIQVQLNNDIIGSFTNATYGALVGTKVGVGFQSTTGEQFGRFGEVAARPLDHAISTTVASLALDQSMVSITADGVLTLHARQALATGENVALGRNSSNSGPLVAPITWSTSDATIATVDAAAGVVSGVAAGTCTITATDGTFSAACALTVTPAVGFATALTYTHEPAGFTQRTDRDFSVFNPAGSPDPWLASAEAATSNMTIVTDATAPKSPSTVLQLQYPAGTILPGHTLTCGTLELDFASNTHTAAYLCRWRKLDPAFQGHPTGANKTGEFFFNNGASGFTHMLTGATCHSTADPVYPGVCLNGGTDYREGLYFTPNLVPTGVEVRGTWSKIEYVLRMNTVAADGTPNFDGEYHVWLNDRKVTELTNLKMADVAGGHLTQWKPSWLWGGLGGTVNTTFFMWEDHEHVSTGT